MTLASIQASAHPDGNRIDLSWLASSGSVAGVRVVRRAGRYPEHPDDGVVVIHDADGAATDIGLHAEQMHYYALFPWQNDPPVYVVDKTNRVAAIATAAHGNSTYMLNALPAIYRRYDAATTTLQRLLDLVGGQLDQLQSLAQFSRSLQNVDLVPGELLPLLGQWIGWRTDYKRRLDAQRDEIRNAPSLYKRVGLVPTVEATVKRISGWECRSKEYVHNVFASNRPERLNLWALRRNLGGVWNSTEHLLSTDFAYDGRPASTLDNNAVQWLIYHTERKGRWEIWAKTTAYVALSSELSSELAVGVISATFWSALTESGVNVEQDATVALLSSQVWELNDGPARWVIEQLAASIRVYRVNQAVPELASHWSASEPVVVDARCNKYPSIALQDDTLWLFWSAYDDAQARWQIRYLRRQDARWSASGPAEPDATTDIALNPFAEVGVYDATRQRRLPFAVCDDNNRLWLFWLEQSGAQWQLRYNRRDAGVWGEPLTMPLDGGLDPRVESDLQVLITPAATPRIYVLWSRYAPIASGETRLQAVIREKADQDFTLANWSTAHALPKAAVDNHHDREPFALLDNNAVHVYWSSNRGSTGWSIWRRTLTDLATDAWGVAERLTEPVYSQRAPLPLMMGNNVWLLFRGNRHIVYESDVYRATETFDERYAGSRSTDVRHQQQITLRDRFADPQRYTYDTGDAGARTDANRIARDTLGAFIAPDVTADDEVQQGIARLRPVVREFMPMTDRAVFVVAETLPTDYVYGYDLPPESDSRYIVSTYSDAWTLSTLGDALGPEEDFSGVLEE